MAALSIVFGRDHLCVSAQEPSVLARTSDATYPADLTIMDQHGRVAVPENVMRQSPSANRGLAPAPFRPSGRLLLLWLTLLPILLVRALLRLLSEPGRADVIDEV